jgi:hypothetical protein
MAFETSYLNRHPQPPNLCLYIIMFMHYQSNSISKTDLYLIFFFPRLPKRNICIFGDLDEVAYLTVLLVIPHGRHLLYMLLLDIYSHFSCCFGGRGISIVGWEGG